MVEYKYQDLFTQTSIDKQLHIEVDDSRDNITNDELAYENFELIESLCSEENLKFGACESSQLKFRVLNNTDILKMENYKSVLPSFRLPGEQNSMTRQNSPLFPCHIL